MDFYSIGGALSKFGSITNSKLCLYELWGTIYFTSCSFSRRFRTMDFIDEGFTGDVSSYLNNWHTEWKINYCTTSKQCWIFNIVHEGISIYSPLSTFKLYYIMWKFIKNYDMKYERERERGGGVMHSLIIQDVLKEIWVALQRIQESYI